MYRGKSLQKIKIDIWIKRVIFDYLRNPYSLDIIPSKPIQQVKKDWIQVSLKVFFVLSHCHWKIFIITLPKVQIPLSLYIGHHLPLMRQFTIILKYLYRENSQSEWKRTKLSLQWMDWKMTFILWMLGQRQMIHFQAILVQRKVYINQFKFLLNNQFN